MMMMAYQHIPTSHIQVGICHNDEGWEYDRVTFPPYTNIMMSIHYNDDDDDDQPDDYDQHDDDDDHHHDDDGGNDDSPTWATLNLGVKGGEQENWGVGEM